MANKKAAEKPLFDTLTKEDKDFFVTSLEKKVRNLNKKLKEIKQLQIDLKEGKELKDSQLQKIASQEEHLTKIKEIEQLARFYLEVKAENLSEKQEPSAQNTANTQDTISSVVKLYYSSQYAHQTNTDNSLANIYNDVFHNNSQDRVAQATAQLLTLIPEYENLTNQIVVSQEFIFHQTLTVAEVIAEPNEVVELVIDEQQVQIEESTQTAFEGVTQEVATNQEQTQPILQEVQAEQPNQNQEVVASDQAPVETIEREKKQYRKRNNQEGDNHRPNKQPREHKERGEQNQREEQKEGGGEQEGQNNRKRGQRNNGNRHHQTEETRDENTNQNTAGDGWNVVKQRTLAGQEGQHKPRTHNYNRENKEGGQYRPRRQEEGEGGQQKPYNSGNRKPFNKDRPQGNHIYVRKDQEGNEASQQKTEAAQTTQEK